MAQTWLLCFSVSSNNSFVEDAAQSSGCILPRLEKGAGVPTAEIVSKEPPQATCRSLELHLDGLQGPGLRCPPEIPSPGSQGCKARPCFPQACSTLGVREGHCRGLTGQHIFTGALSGHCCVTVPPETLMTPQFLDDNAEPGWGSRHSGQGGWSEPNGL